MFLMWELLAAAAFNGDGRSSDDRPHRHLGAGLFAGRTGKLHCPAPPLHSRLFHSLPFANHKVLINCAC